MDHLTALSHKPLTADYCIWYTDLQQRRTIWLELLDQLNIIRFLHLEAGFFIKK